MGCEAAAVHEQEAKRIANVLFKGTGSTMKKDEIVALGVAEDVADKIVALAADELKGYIPKARFDEVNEAKKNAEALVKERDGQLTELKKTAGASEELLKKIGDLEASNKAARFYTDLARAFLTDPDAVEKKLENYYNFVVKKEQSCYTVVQV